MSTCHWRWHAQPANVKALSAYLVDVMLEVDIVKARGRLGSSGLRRESVSSCRVHCVRATLSSAHVVKHFQRHWTWGRASLLLDSYWVPQCPRTLKTTPNGKRLDMGKIIWSSLETLCKCLATDQSSRATLKHSQWVYLLSLWSSFLRTAYLRSTAGTWLYIYIFYLIIEFTFIQECPGVNLTNICICVAL